MEQWRYELYHSSGPWKNHKYIKKVGRRYYYKEYYEDAFNKAQAANAADRDAAYAEWAIQKKETNTPENRKDYTQKRMKAVSASHDYWAAKNLAYNTSSSRPSNVLLKVASTKLNDVAKDQLSKGKKVVSNILTKISKKLESAAVKDHLNKDSGDYRNLDNIRFKRRKSDWSLARSKWYD